MRNYRPDGTLFWNEIVIQPVRDATGKLTHFIGYHRDASERLKQRRARAHRACRSWLREDRLTGLHSRAYFEELLQRDWVLAQRDSHEIGLTLFDIDDLAAYNDTFDRGAGDACIRRVRASSAPPTGAAGIWWALGGGHLRRPDAGRCGRESLPVRAGRRPARARPVDAPPAAGAGRYVT